MIGRLASAVPHGNIHSYAVSQPDLNWENPKVRAEMIKIVDFWEDLGVDGFRCDVLDQISKDFENDNEIITVICNFENSQNINVEENGTIILSNSGRKDKNGVYSPYECVILKEKK